MYLPIAILYRHSLYYLLYCNMTNAGMCTNIKATRWNGQPPWKVCSTFGKGLYVVNLVLGAKRWTWTGLYNITRVVILPSLPYLVVNLFKVRSLTLPAGAFRRCEPRYISRTVKRGRIRIFRSTFLNPSNRCLCVCQNYLYSRISTRLAAHAARRGVVQTSFVQIVKVGVTPH